MLKAPLNQHSKRALCTYAASHALVDFTCAFAVIGSVDRHAGSPTAIAGLILLYNFCAFVLQPFVGMVGDAFRGGKHLAVAGCILAGCGTFFCGFSVLAAVLMGLGNAFFHVGGGICVLRAAGHKASAAGIFIAPGAIGLAAGTVLSRTALPELAGHFICLAIMVLCAAAILLFDFDKKTVPVAATNHAPNGGLFYVVLVFLLGSVFIRSFVGFATPMPWKTTAVLIVFAAVASALGKALGGVLADRVGYIPVASVGLIVSSLLLPFWGKFPLPALLGLLLFNFTMPVVLAALAEIFPGHIGFAFGLNSCALFPGLLFAGSAVSPYLLCAITVVCAGILVFCFVVIPAKNTRIRHRLSRS
jgi:MFS transporter, FSR family, fosmidomycin resistance protein